VHLLQVVVLGMGAAPLATNVSGTRGVLPLLAASPIDATNLMVRAALPLPLSSLLLVLEHGAGRVWVMSEVPLSKISRCLLVVSLKTHY
jgi:hypothetical protein